MRASYTTHASTDASVIATEVTKPSSAPPTTDADIREAVIRTQWEHPEYVNKFLFFFLEDIASACGLVWALVYLEDAIYDYLHTDRRISDGDVGQRDLRGWQNILDRS